MYGCIPFDQMPFCTSLPGHNPRFWDLVEVNIQVLAGWIVLGRVTRRVELGVLAVSGRA
jgi:hypothetical protein